MKKILIIDDDEAILEATTMALEIHGHEVLSLPDTNGLDDLLQKFIPDCILLDYNIGDKNNGRILCDDLKTRSETKNTRILLFTAAVTDQSEFKNKLFSKFDDFVPKPYSLQDLIEKIEA